LFYVCNVISKSPRDKNLDMTNTINSLENEVERLILLNDFTQLLKLFSNCDATFESYRFFLKSYGTKNHKIFRNKEFWISDLPYFHLEDLLRSDLASTFFESYFSKKGFCNDKLNEHLFLISKDQFISSFKAHKCFKHSSFLESLEKISKSDSTLTTLVKEVKIVLKAEIQLDEKVSDENTTKKIFGFGEFSSYFINELNKIKNDPLFIGNFNEITQYEMLIIEEIQSLVKLYRKENSIFFTFKPLPQFCDISKFDFLKKAINNLSQKNKIEMFYNGYSNFINVHKDLRMQQTNKYLSYLENNQKYQVEDLYLSKISHNNLTFSNPKSIESCISFWEKYDLPRTIIYKNEKIDIYKVFEFLKSYSIDIPTYDIRVFYEDFLIKNIVETFHWSEKEVISLIDFLTFDLSNPNENGWWLSKPLFKEDNQIFWLGGLLKNRRWEIVLYNRIKSDCCIFNHFDEDKNKWIPLKDVFPFNFEEKVKKLFNDFGFITLKIGNFSNPNGETGEIDVLAYKDNYLFVCEVKTGKKSDGFNMNDDFENRIIRNQAYFQVQKEATYVSENLKSICNELKINDKISLDKIKIIKLIVTDFYSGDIETVNNDVLKTTLLELEVNLKNDKKSLFETYLISQSFLNSNNQFYKNPNLENINWDLWNGKKELSVQQLVENLKNNAVWKELELVWDFKPGTFSFEA